MGCGRCFRSSSEKLKDDESPTVDVEEEDLEEGAVVHSSTDVRGEFMKSVMTTKDNSSKVTLNMKVVEMLKEDSIFVIVYSKFSHDTAWVQLAMTEFNDEEKDTVSFSKTVELKFHMEKHRMLRFEVFKIRDTVFQEDLKYQKFLGCCECSLIQIMMARSKGTGWLVKDLLHPKKGLTSQGNMCVWAEEDFALKQRVSFNLSAQSVPSADFWKGRPDPYVNLQRQNPAKRQQITYQQVLRTEVARRTGNPKWERLEFEVPQLWPLNTSTEVRVELRDWFRVARDVTIGEAWLAYDDVTKSFSDSKPLVLPVFKAGTKKYAKKLKSGKKRRVATTMSASAEAEEMGMKKYQVGAYIELTDVGVLRRYSFLDYVRGGMELRLVVAIDFTRSNGEPFEDRSLHKMDAADPGASNAYTNVIQALGGIMGNYDSDNRYPVFGFGAKVPPSKTVASDAFALTGDFFDPEVEGIDGIVDAYRRACRVVSFCGPTRLSAVTELGRLMAQPYAECQTKKDLDMAFYVMVIITDGAIADDDKHNFVKALQQVADAPLCVVVIGIGKADFSFLKGVAREVRESRWLAGVPEEELNVRDLVKFVHLGDKDSTFLEMEEKSAQALAQVPQEVVGYYSSRNIKPRKLEEHEDDAGRPKPPPNDPIPENKKKAGSRSGSRSFTNRSGTNRMGTNRSGTNRMGTNRVGTNRTATNRSGTNRMGTNMSGGRMGTNRSEGSEYEEDFAIKRMREEEAKRQRILGRLPPYIRERRESLRKQAVSLGYDKNQVLRAIRDGCPADDIEMLVDCIVNGGYGKAPSFKDLVEKAFETKVESQIVDLLSMETATMMITQTQDLLNCDRVSLFVHDTRLNKLKLYAANLALPISLPMGQGIAGWVFDECVTANIPDCYKDYRFDRVTDAKFNYLTKSMLCTPVLNGESQPLGVLQALNKFPAGVDRNTEDGHLQAVPFKKQDEATLEALAKSLREMLERGRVDNQTLQQMLATAQVMREMESDLSKLLDEESIGFLLVSMQTLIRCDRVSLFIYDKTCEELVLYASNNLSSPGIRLKPGGGIAGMVFQDQDILTIDDCYEDSRFDSSYDFRNGYRTKSVCVVPIVDERGESVGVIQAINKLPVDFDPEDPKAYLKAIAFKPDDEKVLSTVADKLGQGIQRGNVNCRHIAEILALAAAKRKGRHHEPLQLELPSSYQKEDDLERERAEAAQEEVRQRYSIQSEDLEVTHTTTEQVCQICVSRPVGMIMYPCGHSATCTVCGPPVGSNCPVCEAPVEAVRKMRELSPLAVNNRRSSRMSLLSAMSAMSALPSPQT